MSMHCSGARNCVHVAQSVCAVMIVCAAKSSAMMTRHCGFSLPQDPSAVVGVEVFQALEECVLAWRIDEE